MKTKSTDILGTKKLFPLLMQMSIPAVIGMLVGSLYNIVDTIFVGRGGGALAIAGLSIAFPVQMIALAFAQMIGIGASSIISLRLGEKKQDKAESALGTSFTALITASIIMSVILLIFSKPILTLFGASENTFPYADNYLGIIAFGIPFLSIGMAGSNLIRSEGRSKTAMITMLTGMVLNIILDPVFIIGLGMGISGAALATVISQGCSAFLIMGFYITGRSVLNFNLKNMAVNTDQLKRMMLLGMPNFFQTAGMSILVLIINNTLLHYSGDLAISVYGIINRLLSIVILPVIGISQGFQPIAGYNYGAGNFDRVKKILLTASLTAAGFAFCASAVMELFPRFLFSIFTSHEELINKGETALRIMASLISTAGFQIIFSIYFQAVGKGLHSLFLGLSRQFLILIPMIIILPIYFKEMGVWLSFPLSDLLAVTITVIVVARELRHLDIKHGETVSSAT